MSDQTISRRQFAIATVAVPVAAIFATRAEAAASLPKLDLNDPVAKALQYTHNATTVDKKKSPTYKPGSTCANCIQIQGPKAEWQPCTAFPGKLVASKGWCSAWAAKPA